MFNAMPPLNAVRAFEAAARHRSFRLAAEELHVTPGAVSQQIKLLEEWLEVRLFNRGTQGVTLTDAGDRFFLPLTDALQCIARAAASLRPASVSQALTITVLPSFAVKWLVPRLGQFRSAHPSIAVRIDARPTLADFRGQAVDVGLRLGQGNYSGMHAVFMMAEEFYPVCSPRLLESGPPLKRPEDLIHHTLLHDESYSQWQRWATVHQVPNVTPQQGLVFNDAAMVLQAVMDGQGVALTRSGLAALDVAEGRLVRLFDLPLPADQAYYVVCREDRRNEPAISAFRDWVLAEAQAFTRETGNTIPLG